MSVLCKLNYPIETELQKKFWSSRHKCNKAKSIIAYSLTLSNANDNLRRSGYTYQWRKKAIIAYSEYVNTPSFIGVPFSELSTPWWECMPVHENTSLKAWFINFCQHSDVCAEIQPWYGSKGSEVEFTVVWEGGCTEEDEHLQYVARGDTDNEGFIAVDDLGNLAFYGFDLIEGERKLVAGKEQHFRMRANIDVELRHIGSFGTHHPRYTFNGILFDLKLNGSDYRHYPMMIISRDQPHTTVLSEDGGNNGEILGDNHVVNLWLDRRGSLKLWDDSDTWGDGDWIEYLDKIDTLMLVT